MVIRDEIQKKYTKVEEHIYLSDSEGYWSNLNKDENNELIDSLQHMSTRDAIKKYHQWLYNVIFSVKRSAGLELLEMSGDEVCIDCGCMWGALTIPLAKRCKYVFGIDQTFDSLKFLNARRKEEKLENIDLLCKNLKSIDNDFDNRFDVAIVNGVLEWIPEEGPIELKSYYGKYAKKKIKSNPYLEQKTFLKNVNRLLQKGGKLYLAIENRYDFKMFFGVKDPHANLLFTSLLPRKIANWISIVKLGRPYVSWLYSFKGIGSLIKQSGFTKVDLYMCFPDYRFPERIIPYNQSLKDFNITISSRNAKGKRTAKRFLARSVEYFIFKILKAKVFAPSIIAIGYK
jgi:SAM-dependent methyltransferase